MALFGKKKKAEQAAPQTNPEDDIQIVGGDAEETDVAEDNEGQVIDFDAIAGDLNADDGGSEMGDPLDDTVAPAALGDDRAVELPDEEDDLFATTPGFETANKASLNADDELDFDAVFDDDSQTNVPIAATTPETDENPFGAAPDIEPVATDAAAITADTPPLTYTAPLTTPDIVAGGHSPAARRALPLLPLLGAAGLLVALGVVGWTVLGQSKPEETAAPVVVTKPAPPAGTTAAVTTAAGTTATATTGAMTPVTTAGVISAPGGPAGAVNPGIAVDGIPIAPGPIVQTATLGSGTLGGALVRPQAPQTGGSSSPALEKRLKDLWNKGAAAKRARNFAGARASWYEILRLDPGHKGIQSAIDKLPGA